MVNEYADLVSLKEQFLQSCGQDYHFPSGGDNEILTSSERALYLSLNSGELSNSEKIKILAVGLDTMTRFDLVIFSVRIAIMAVRISDPTAYQLGVLVLAAGCPQLDWRDTLKAFVIFDNCGSRIGVSFEREVEATAVIMESEVLRPSIDRYFSRPLIYRSLRSLGVAEKGAGDDLTFYTY